jgi:Uma2 family endonuclease
MLSEEEYRRIALGDPQGQLELHDGLLREKPARSVERGHVMTRFMRLLDSQLDWDAFQLRVGHARLRVTARDYYVPDMVVIPASIEQALRQNLSELDAYPEPLPLVIEIWSPSTGDYDVQEKLPDYQRRGDLEVWSVHPYERTLTAWRQQSNGSYAKTAYRDGVVHPQSLPGVAIDLEVLFAE